MNSNQLFKQIAFFQKRGFTTSVFNYGAATNPHVYMTVSKDGQNVGNLVF